MEPLTHFLFGGIMARAGLNRTSALATVTLVLAAEAPDLDVLTEFGGRVYGFQHHRGITHTFLGVPFLAGFMVLLIFLGHQVVKRKQKQVGASPPRWGVLWLLAVLAGLSHILLDYTNNYGVRPFAPFSYRWYSWDIVFIVDPILWTILLGGLLLPALFGLVGDEIRSRRTPASGRAGAVLALLLVAGYWGMRDFEHRRAVAAMEALTYRGEIPQRVSAYPYMLNLFRWAGVVETTGFYDSMTVDSLAAQTNPGGNEQIRYKSEPTPQVLAADNSYFGRVFLDWAQYPIMETETMQNDNGEPTSYLVRFIDLRYAYLGKETVLAGWVELDRNLAVIRQNFGTFNAR